MGTERILIIEDDPEIQEMLQYAFAREGWKLIHAKPARRGLRLCNQRGRTASSSTSCFPAWTASRL
jgi:DNA-binding response OmpR family regulator